MKKQPTKEQNSSVGLSHDDSEVGRDKHIVQTFVTLYGPALKKLSFLAQQHNPEIDRILRAYPVNMVDLLLKDQHPLVKKHS